MDQQSTPGISNEIQLDGASDGTHNYIVEFYNDQLTDVVIQTDSNWQNPSILFTIGPGNDDYAGITYDPANNSLWIGGWNRHTVTDYSLSGTVLSSFDTGHSENTALAYDSAAGTLWLSNSEFGNLEQWSTTGTMLQSGAPSGLPLYSYFAGEFAEPSVSTPEPASLLVLGAALTGLGVLRRRYRVASDA